MTVYIKGSMNIFKAVRKFWEIGHPDKVKTKPEIPKLEIQRLNMHLIKEEWEELQDAVEVCDLVEMADAMADLIYVIVGMAVTHGIPLEEVFAEVHRTNMAKFPEGKVLRRASDGKVMKPEGWRPPDIKYIIDRAKN